jgi:hypothetical protein
MTNESKCPVCKVALNIQFDENNHSYEICPKCNRTYYPFPVDELINNDDQNENNDIEPVSNDRDEGPILLCLEDSNDREKDYLRRKFGNYVTVESEIYIPTE